MVIKTFQDLSDDARKIRQEVFVEEQGFQDEFDERDHHCTHCVFYMDSKPVGTCRYFFDEDKSSYVLGRIAIVKEKRGQGLGLEIVRYALSCIDTHYPVILHAQIQATPFYQRLGFEKYGDIEYEEHCPHIWMKYQR